MEKIEKTEKSEQSKPAKFEKFKQGCILIFKKWTAFRFAIDHTPKILTYYNEDGTVLEINEMLDKLYEELFNIINDKKFIGKYLIDELADCLNGFIDDYFNIGLEDESDFEIAQILVKLYNDIDNYLEKLKKNDVVKIKYDIDFPILGTQKIIFEKGVKEEEEEDEEEYEDEDDEDSDKCCEHNDGHEHGLQNNNNEQGNINLNNAQGDNNQNSSQGINSQNNKMEIDDGPDDDGFITVKKGKGKKY